MKFLITIIVFLSFHNMSAQNNKIKLYNPFSIEIDPMERLLLINIEKDPDSLYIGFEPQVFNDAINGKGHLVIGWRTDGKVDVYHQPTLILNPSKYDIAGKGLANMVATNFSTAHYTVNDNGVQANYIFTDLNSRSIVLSVNESNPKQRKPFGLLAPMGSAAENPSSMPLVLLHDFYFVRQKHTDITISIEGKLHVPDKLPMPIDGAKMYFTRYSPDPLIATFNPNHHGKLSYTETTLGRKTVNDGDYEYNLVWNNETPAIQFIIRKNEKHPLTFRFEPAFPNVCNLQNGVLIKGKFEIEGDNSTGKIEGHYVVFITEGKTTIELIPSKGWIPRPDKFSLRFLYTVGKVFKKWPATYRWDAEITEEDADFIMQSQWTRTNH